MKQALVCSALATLLSVGVATAGPLANTAPATTAEVIPAANADATSAAAARDRPATSSERSIEFSAANIALAFDYLDRDKNGSISRDEAAGIRGVARNFDRADLDRNNMLSRDEFTDAMKRSKAR